MASEASSVMEAWADMKQAFRVFKGIPRATLEDARALRVERRLAEREAGTPPPKIPRDWHGLKEPPTPDAQPRKYIEVGGVNHAPHLVIALFTGGLWLPVWIMACIVTPRRRTEPRW
jgi:hypothetical protein